MKGNRGRLVLLAVIVALVGAFFVFDLGHYLTLAYLKEQQRAFADFYAEHRLATIAGYMLVYILVTALSLPGATVMTLAGGALFGLWTALVAVSFASSIGATLAFLVSRFLLRDGVQKRFGDKLRAVNAGIERDGPFYLFSLRLVPIFPFFVINLVMGLTPIRAAVFYAVSQVGMLPGTFVYVNAGTQLGRLETAAGILSPGLLVSFALLGVFPLLARKGLEVFKGRRALRGYPRPRRYDYNLVVLGAGSAGLVSAYIAAAVKAKVALVEKHRMGGDCLNTGCVPSKALLRSAKILSYARRARDFGIERMTAELDFARVMERVQRVVEEVAPHDSVARYTGLGVEVIQGEARVTSPFTVEVNGRTLTTRSIIVATGASPLVPSIPGLAEAGYLTSDTLWTLRQKPERLVVLGGGPIGCELSQAMARLGIAVTQVEMAPRLLLREDPEVSAYLRECFEAEGVRVLTGHAAREVRVDQGRKVLVCEVQGGGAAKVEIEFDAILVAVGRKANVSGFGLEELGVRLSTRGTLEADPWLRTNYPNILCAGDVVGPYQFTHTAGHQAWYAAVNALFSPLRAFKVDTRVIPWCTFTDPEIARVGLSESEATEQGVEVEVTRYDFAELDRAIADSEARGWIKVLTPKGKDRILGVTIVGTHAGDLLAEFVLAMKHGLGLNKILGTIHIYPTLAEAGKATAGVWERAHVPVELLTWVERYHRWRRGR